MPAPRSKPKAADQGPFALKGPKASSVARVGRAAGQIVPVPGNPPATGFGGTKPGGSK